MFRFRALGCFRIQIQGFEVLRYKPNSSYLNTHAPYRGQTKELL